MATQWYISDNAAGLNRAAIPGATATFYKPVLSQAGKYLDRVHNGLKSPPKLVKVFQPGDTKKPLLADWNFKAMTPGTYTTIKDSSANEVNLSMGLGTNITIATVNGRNEAVFDGTKTLRQTNKAFWKKLHDGTRAFTIMVEARVSDTANPNTAYGLIGNNGTSGANVGIAVWADNRTSSSIFRRLTLHLAAGGAVANFPGSVYSIGVDNTIPFAKSTFTFISFVPIQAQDNIPATQFNNAKVVVDGFLQNIISLANTNYSTANATFDLEIGGAGNGVFPLVGGVHRVTLWGGELSADDRRRLMSAETWTPGTHTRPLLEPEITRSIKNGDYSLAGHLGKNPVSGKWISLYQRSAGHTETLSPSEAYLRVSADGRFNDSQEAPIWVDGSNKRHILAGYTSTGRLVSIYCTYSRTTPGLFLGAFSRYSDDDGTTWSQPVAIGSVPAALVTWVGFEQIIQASDGSLQAIAYGFNAAAFASATQFYIHRLRSTDNGASFAFYDTVYTGATYVNESSLVETSPGKFTVVSRVEATVSDFRVFSFNGTTWTNNGTFTLEASNTLAHPPHLRTFTLNGQKIVALYWVNRAAHQQKVIYVRASVLESSNIAAFTGRARYVIDTPRERTDSGYDSIQHPDNTLAAVALGFNQYGPTSANNSSGLLTEIFYYQLPATHEALVIAELGI